MSYEIVKSIKRNKNNNSIFITSASNNVWPRDYSEWEFMPNEKYSIDEIKNKELYLFHSLIGGSLQLSGSVNENWRYACNKFFDYCRKNNLDCGDIWDLPYKDKNKNIESLKPYYDVFKEFLEEKIEGKYYLSSNIGCITRVNENDFDYIPYSYEIEKYSGNYKKIYNNFCKLSNSVIDKYDIKIEKLSKELKQDSTLTKTIYEQEYSL